MSTAMLRRDFLTSGFTGRAVPKPVSKTSSGLSPAAAKQMDCSRMKNSPHAQPQPRGVSLMPEVVARLRLVHSAPLPNNSVKLSDSTSSRIKRRKSVVQSKQDGQKANSKDESQPRVTSRSLQTWEYLKISTPRQGKEYRSGSITTLCSDIRYGGGAPSGRTPILRKQLTVREVADPPNTPVDLHTREPWDSDTRTDFFLKSAKTTRDVPRFSFRRPGTPIPKCEAVQIVDLRVATFVDRARGEYEGPTAAMLPTPRPPPKPVKSSPFSSLLQRAKRPNNKEPETSEAAKPRWPSLERPRSKRPTSVINYDKLLALYVKQGERRLMSHNSHLQQEKRAPRTPATFPSLTALSPDAESEVSEADSEGYRPTESRMATRGTCRPVSRDYRSMYPPDEDSLSALSDDSGPLHKLRNPPPTRESQVHTPRTTARPNLTNGFIVTKLDIQDIGGTTGGESAFNSPRTNRKLGSGEECGNGQEQPPPAGSGAVPLPPEANPEAGEVLFPASTAEDEAVGNSKLLDVKSRNTGEEYQDDPPNVSETTDGAPADTFSTNGTDEEHCQHSDDGAHFRMVAQHDRGALDDNLDSTKPGPDCNQGDTAEQNDEESILQSICAHNGVEEPPQESTAQCIPISLDGDAVESVGLHSTASTQYLTDAHHGDSGIVITCLSPSVANNTHDHVTRHQDKDSETSESASEEAENRPNNDYSADAGVTQRKVMFDDSAYTSFQHAKFGSSPQRSRRSKPTGNICYNSSEKVKFLKVKIGEKTAD